MLNVSTAMEKNPLFKEWVLTKIRERQDRIHEKWFREIINEWAEEILKEEKQKDG